MLLYASVVFKKSFEWNNHGVYPLVQYHRFFVKFPQVAGFIHLEPINFDDAKIVHSRVSSTIAEQMGLNDGVMYKNRTIGFHLATSAFKEAT